MRGFRRLSGTLFSLSYGLIPRRTTPGGACVVSAKAVPRAVARNRIKRRCRSILLGMLRDADSPLVLVWHAKKGAAKASFAEIEAEMLALSRTAVGSLAGALS
ncbi:hypothetical protein A2765_02340 [Candidatus Kaiserbacteria bacterium RIFCSPHIGHO2_01_FULL_56_24]|uniref:Uncharacterized protein n=1 Tax=Candidatus Kaiserbacteria bacterium RIFCSPHIGHO2_01_FULL_56_24 TaxID=1798487 RepID=A0A1F6DAV8_9BACT|nr:MAG: hypothetical protein A2765_02340 [Candidatus Kaiserbacteria bacterium RIFCSPHIGHO2_01_FULL_56_24]